MTKLVFDGAANAAKGAKLNSKDGRAAAEGRSVVDPLAGALVATVKGVPQAKVGAVPVATKANPKVDAVKIVKQDDAAQDEKNHKDEAAQPTAQGEHLAMVDSASAAAVGLVAAEQGEPASGSGDDSDDGDSTPLIIGGVLLAGGAIALAASGGGGNKTPANAAPVVTAATGTATEDGAKVTAKVTATDANNDTLTFALKTGSTAPAGFSIASDGTYTFDPANAAYQSLGAGKTTQAVANITVSDGKGGSTDSTVTITVTGVNDVATIAGAKTGAVTEDAATTTATGTLTVTDVDSGENVFVAQTDKVGTFGKFSIGTDGKWTYTLDNSDTDTQALGAGKTGTDSFVVKSSDGTGSETVTVTVTGVNDPATISGTKTGGVTEDAVTTTATGTLTVSDKDTGESTFQAVASTKGTYGAFAMGTDGKWTYTLDNTDTDTQALGAGKTGTETFTVKSSDGTATDTVTITVTGVNDPALIAGVKVGAVTEDSASTLASSGKLTVTDVDTGESSFQAQASTKAAYGTFTLATDGAWTYSADNSQTAIQSLGAGKTLTDTLTVKSFDGTTDTVTVTITGVNDAATIAGVKTGDITEDATPNTVAGTLTVTDIDAGEAVFQAQTGAAGTYGKFDVATDGKWTYTLDNSLPATQALSANDTKTEIFAVKSADGTTSSVTVTVHGANEPLSIDVDNDGDINTAHTIDAGLGAFILQENGAVSNNVIITNVTSEDRFQLTTNPTPGPGADATYLFAVQGNDLVINYGDGSGHTSNIVVKGVVDAPFFLGTEAEAETALNNHFGTTNVDYFTIA